MHDVAEKSETTANITNKYFVTRTIIKNYVTYRDAKIQKIFHYMPLFASNIKEFR